MKRLLYSFGLLAALIAVSLLWENSFQGNLHELMDMSQKGLDAMAAEDYEAAGQVIGQLSEKFEVLEEKWTIVINHNLLDEVSNATTEVRALLEQEEYSHAAAQLTVVKTLFKDLDDHYKFSLGNIF